MPKAQPNIQPKAYVFYYFQCGTQGYSPIIITSSSEYKTHQFLIHSMLFFQQSPTWIEIDKTQCKWQCRHRESRRKVTLSGEVACGFELSFVKDYRIY